MAAVRMLQSLRRAICGQQYLINFRPAGLLVCCLIFSKMAEIFFWSVGMICVLVFTMSSRSLMTMLLLLERFSNAFTELSRLLMMMALVSLLSIHLFDIVASVL